MRLIPNLFLITFIACPLLGRTPSLTLREACAQALQRNPTLAALDWELRAGDARIRQANRPPNPEISLDLENLAGSGSFGGGAERESTLQFSQLLETSGRRRARVSVAREDRAAASWEYEIQRIEVLKTTTQAFVAVLAAQRSVKLAEELARLAEDSTPVTQQRVDAGAAGAVELTRSALAVATAKMELEQARRALSIARGNLAMQWGSTVADFPEVTGDLDRVKPLPALEALRERLSETPRLARWQAERERRRARLGLAQTEARPDLTLSVGPRLAGSGEDVTFVAAGSLPLPLWHRNEGAIAEAQAQLSKTDAEMRSVEVAAAAALNESWHGVARALAEAEILRKDVLPNAEKADRQVAEGYAAGRFSQLEVLDARRALVDARKQQLQSLAEYHKAVAEVEALTAKSASNFTRN